MSTKSFEGNVAALRNLHRELYDLAVKNLDGPSLNTYTENSTTMGFLLRDDLQ